VSATKKLTQARETLAEIEAKVAELSARRRGRLLAGDGAGAIASLDGELEKLKHAGRIEQDRIAILEAEAAREEREAIAKRRAGLIDRFERKLEVADAKADELQATMEKAEQLFREIIKLREEARIAWPIGDTAPRRRTAEGACLSGLAVRTLMYECAAFTAAIPGWQSG
jgi:hypothetical protein